jgi:hypothetical protein
LIKTLFEPLESKALTPEDSWQAPGMGAPV